jgi:squalene-hopene/tetraprenyl-beta-curcumene cyclase
MPLLRRKLLLTVVSLSACLSFMTTLMAADTKKSDGQRAREKAVAKAIDYLRQKGQAEDGSFSPQTGPAVTALVTSALLRNGLSVNDPLVAKALKYMESFVHEDGGIYQQASTHQNYETCVAIVAFSNANRDGRYDKLLKKAEAYVKGLQWDEEEGHDESSFNYGGAGYGGKKRPDLSNTSFLIDALKAVGNGPEDKAMKKALIFVSHCQNLETEHNATPFAAKNPDGGFYYTVAAGGESFAGKLDNGGLRSYGSMTYAGLKSMIFAGVGPDDARVKAAVEWVRKNYSLDSNPGMGDAGLYYYYHTFAKALDAVGQAEFTDADGTKHNWRDELATELAGRQSKDGSWSNKNSRWMEGDPNLVTGYALLALSYCREPAKAAQ